MNKKLLIIVLFLLLIFTIFILTRPIGCINPTSPNGTYYETIGFAPAWKCYVAKIVGQNL